MDSNPLRYEISSWDQLVACQSNYSNKLHIKVKKIIQDDRLNGTIIDMVHEDFGSLFCYLVDGYGPLLASNDPIVYELPCSAILKELERYGFLITFSCREHIPDDQIEYLKTVQKLGFDKIRILYVYAYASNGAKLLNPHVVIFNIEPNPGWMDNTYSASYDEYLDAISSGTAINLSSISETNRFHWDWLDSVASIQDIIDDNSQ